jgi:hypothetical protein
MHGNSLSFLRRKAALFVRSLSGFAQGFLAVFKVRTAASQPSVLLRIVYVTGGEGGTAVEFEAAQSVLHITYLLSFL